MISGTRLHELHRRLAQTATAAGWQLAQLRDRRADVLQRAAAAGDLNVRMLLARQIRLLDHRADLLYSQQALAQRQLRLVERLVYATEQAEIAQLLEDAAAEGSVDWADALSWAAVARPADGGRLRLVEEFLTWLEDLLPRLPEPAAGPASEWATVVHVPDGDGAKLADGRRVRYVGIDAPEINLHGRAEPHAQEAKEVNHALVVGRQVRLERDESESDGYGRLLRYVWVGDTFVNAELVRCGAAYALAVPPDTRYQPLLARLERQARRARRGVWA